jgi:glucose-6-phosphate 1-dehydrogenase
MHSHKHPLTKPIIDVNKQCLTFVIFGASGDLAKRKTLPALYFLFKNGFLPSEPKESLNIFGYARTQLSIHDFRNQIKKSFSEGSSENTKEQDFNNFINHLHYVSGHYNDCKGFERLRNELINVEKHKALRVFYFAVPPGVFSDIARGVHQYLMTSDPADTRIIVEKPFGKDTLSSDILQKELLSMFSEDQIFRIDHYLGKEMVKNILVLRFANFLISSIWNRSTISNVQITFKETIGIEGRGSYFDEYGIIRDVIQNHLLQILCLIAMERPASLDPEAIRDEKTRVLKYISPINMNELVLGQYEGYRNDPTVSGSSLAPTYAALVLRINSERWNGVPFIIKCGKGLDTKKTEIRIQFRDCPGSIFNDSLARNELVLLKLYTLK